MNSQVMRGWPVLCHLHTPKTAGVSLQVEMKRHNNYSLYSREQCFATMLSHSMCSSKLKGLSLIHI